MPATPGALTARARLAVLAAKRRLKRKSASAIEPATGDKPDAPAVATITAVRAAARMTLAPETDTAAPAVAGDDTDAGFIHELHA